MRPLGLLLEAIGPFCSEQEVRFEALAQDRPFAIEGPVGSGKSFLLDALVFVLYGETATPERSLEELRCSFAQQDRESRVGFDFDLSGVRYRVERRWRPGELSVHSARFWRSSQVQGEERLLLLAEGQRPCGDQAVRLLGLEAEQFRQVCVIPQGHFGRLLLAPAAERGRLLARLVGLERLKDFENALRDRHRAAEQEALMLQTELTALLKEFECSTLEQLEEKYVQSQQALELLDEELQELQHRSGEWSRKLETAAKYETLARQRDLAVKELELLESDETRSAETEQADLRRALTLFADWQRAQEQKRALRQKLEALEQSPPGETFDGTVAAELAQIRQFEEEKFGYRRALERLEATERELLGLAELEAQAERSREAWLSLQEREQLQRQQHQRLKKRLQLLSKRRVRLQEMEAELARLAPLFEAAQRRAQRLQQQLQLQELYLQVRARADRLQEAEQELHGQLTEQKSLLFAARSEAAAARRVDLVRSLEPGRPCPVCGSLEHPNPSPSRSADPAQADLLSEQLETDCETLSQKLEHARQERERAALRCATLEGKLEQLEGEETHLEPESAGDLDKLESKVRRLRQQLEMKEPILEELAELEAQVRSLRRERKQLRLGRERLEALSETAERTLELEREKLQNRLLEVLDPDLHSEHPLLDRLRRELHRVAERLGELEERTDQSEEAARLARLFSERLSEQKVLATKLEEAEQGASAIAEELLGTWGAEYGDWEQLQQRLTRFQREQRLHRDRLVDRELLVGTVKRQLDQSQELLSALPPPEESTAQLSQTIAAERESLANRSARRATLSALRERLQEAIQRARALDRECLEAGSQAELMEPLLRSVEPVDPAGFGPFARWALRRFFERALQATNLHLQGFAPDRFYLQCDDQLNLWAWDLTSGHSRSPGSLSGGERFLASLALSLGLGDALSEEEQTAPRPRTLLLDEGFGALDTASLEAALAGLELLSGLGYTVGAVSHLKEVRTRFSQRLKVWRQSPSAEASIEIG